MDELSSSSCGETQEGVRILLTTSPSFNQFLTIKKKAILNLSYHSDGKSRSDELWSVAVNGLPVNEAG